MGSIENSAVPINAVVVGGGIGGLIAAASLRQAGHKVTLIEKYSLSTVVGAALHVNPNGGRVLQRLGFDPVRARACHPHHWNVLRGHDLEQINAMPLSATPGHPNPGTITVHRADLHTELVRLATSNECEGEAAWGPPVRLYAETAVASVREDGAGVVLESGEEVSGDLIVGADGVHSAVRDYVTKSQQGTGKAVHSGMAAFRFLLDSDKLREDEELTSLLDTTKDVVNLLADTTDVVNERHMVWYSCKGGELQNFVGIHPSSSANIEDDGEELKAAMSREFGQFDPRIVKIMGMSKNIKRWPLYIYDPLPAWVRGRVVLIGDAAHPMLPFGGQGAAQAMEDGAALAYLLKDQNDIDSALTSFQTVRQNRASRVQILSSARAGKEQDVAEKLQPYLDDTAPHAPKSLLERVQHDFGYDVFSGCDAILS